MSQSTSQTSRSKEPRTNQQNKALHVYFQELANTLNDAGLDMRRTLKEDIDIPWTADNIKEYIWRPIMQAQLGKDSTTDLTTEEIDNIYETANRYLGQKHGVHVAFPSIDEQYKKKIRR